MSPSTRPGRFASSLTAVLLLGLAACGDAAPVGTKPAPSLPVEEARELLETLALVSSVDLAALVRAAYESPSVGISADYFTDTVACPAGGVTIVRGVLDFDQPEDEVVLEWADDFRGCGAHSSSGRRWEFDAQLPLATHFSIPGDAAGPDAWFTGRVVGRIRYSTVDGEGSCDIDLDIKGLEAALSVLGSVCGHPPQALAPSAGGGPGGT